MNIDTKTDSYVIFSLGKMYFGVSVRQVIEVLQFIEIVQVPKSADFIIGVINFRGEVVTVIDMYKLFHIDDFNGIRKNILVMDLGVEYDGAYLGIQVDKVLDVKEIHLRDLSNAPETGFKFNPEYLLGVYNDQDKMILIMNALKILSEEMLVSLIEKKN